MKEEKEVKVLVEINDQKFLDYNDSILFQNINEKEVTLHIKSKTTPNNIKILISK